MNNKNRTLGEVFEAAVDDFPDRLALKKGDVKYTYAQLKKEDIKLKN